MSSSRNSQQPGYSLDDYVSGDAPYAELYELRDDQFAFHRRKSVLIVESRKAGYTGFWATYQAYEAAQTGSRSPDANVTAFTGQPMELDCGAWHAGDYGISLASKEGEMVACVHPIEPVKRLVNVDTGVEKIELAYCKGKMWRRLTVDRQVIASAQKIVALSDNGIAVTTESSKALVRYLHDIENYNYGLIPEIASIDRLGHIADHGFSPYVEGLVYDGDEMFGSAFKAVRSGGSFDVWAAEMRKLRAYNIAAKIVIASSFASALVEPLGALSFFVHLWGTASGTGKTVALMAAASVWADPTMGRYVKSFNSTTVGFEMYAGFLNSLPLIIDELQLSRNAFGKSRFSVYQLAEGVGRLRGRRTGGIERTATWRNCILTSGETPLTQDNSGAGAVNRVIDIGCNNEEEKVIENGRETAAIVSRNFGHAGRRFIGLLTDDVIAQCKKDYDAVTAVLSASDATDKQALSAALIVVADRLVAQHIFHDTPLTTQEISSFLQTNASVDINSRCYEYLCDWVATNRNRFDARDAADVYGTIDGEWAYIIRSVFNRALDEEGYSAKGFLGWAKRKHLIDVRDDKGYTKTKRIGKIVTECVVLMLPQDPEEAPF